MQKTMQLIELKNKYNLQTDKWSDPDEGGCNFHNYLQIYEEMFCDIKDDKISILEIFKLKDVHSQTKEYHQKIIESESVSLHIRRGDYINSIHDTCDMEYYKKAVMEILKINKQM